MQYTLKDAEFGMRNHCFNFNENVSLCPDFGALEVWYKGELLGLAKKDDALDVVEILLDGIDGLSGEEEELAKLEAVKELIK